MIEMLVVIAVFGILLSIGALLINGLLQRQRLNEASRVFGESLRRVSELAVTESQPITATVSATQLSWAEDGGANRGSQPLPYNAEMSSSSSTNFTFNGRGLPTEPETFVVTLGSNSRTIYLLPTGAVTYQ